MGGENIKSIAVIGCGHLGKVVVKGLVDSFVGSPSEIIVCDRDSSVAQKLHKELGVCFAGSVREAVSGSEVIFVAVRPNDVVGVMKDVASMIALGDSPIIISTAAGVRISAIKKHLPNNIRVARVMPNLAAKVKESMTGIFSDNLGAAKIASLMFGSIGKTVILDDEKLLDVTTALAGSGPAFVYEFLIGCIDGGVAMGLSGEESQHMAQQMILGALELIVQEHEDPQDLIKRIAVPGGTTEAGISILRNNNLSCIVKEAIIAATKRAEAIANETEK